MSLLPLIAALVSGCSSVFGVDIPEQTLTAACGMCVFHEPPAAGCYWAVEIDGAHYPVNGPVPADHDAHGPEGMCTMPRKAVVAGTLRSGQLFASKFELLPVDASDPRPAAPAHEHTH